MKRFWVVGLAVVGVLTVIAQADASAIRGNAGFTTSTLAPNDDGSTGLVATGITMDLWGSTYSSLYVNNNGNVTFGGSMGTYTPFSLLSTSVKILAPYFADVDTSYAGAPVTYGTSTVGGRAAFGVNWIDVDYYSSSGAHTKRNDFQLVIIDRSDIAVGDFDFEFNYDRVEWETGDASGGSGGLGGFSARVGYSNGTTTAFELTGSAVNGAFLDGGPLATSLIVNSLNSAVAGRYLFTVRSGVVPPTVIPEPASVVVWSLLAAMGLTFGWYRRRKAA